MVLVGKVGVGAIATWLCVAADLQRREIVSAVVMVVFNCELLLLDYDDLSTCLALVSSYSLLFF